MNAFPALLALVVAWPGIAQELDDYHCADDYGEDFAFASDEHSIDTAAGSRVVIRWGPHGYTGGIYLGEPGEAHYLERVSTFYLRLNCAWSSIERSYDYKYGVISSRSDCEPLAVSNGRAEFDCRGVTTSLQSNVSALGPFIESRDVVVGAWLQTERYIQGKLLLQKLERDAIRKASAELNDALALEPCPDGLQPIDQYWSVKQNSLRPTVDSKLKEVTVKFTIEPEGTVSQILLRQNVDLTEESSLAYDVRQWRFPPRQRACRHQWTHWVVQQ